MTTVSIVGVFSTGSVGSLRRLTAVAGISQVGSLSISSSKTLTGVAGSGHVGSLSINNSSNISLTGVAGNGQIGSLDSASLTGVAGTGVATGGLNFTVVNIGTANTNSTAVNIACTVPAGATICVIWFDTAVVGGTGPSAITDTSFNSYAVYDVTVTTTGTVGISYAVNAKAVSGHLTCTPHSNEGGIYSAFYVTGVTSYDSTVANSATGIFSGAVSPSITGGTPGQNDLQIGVIGWALGGSNYTQSPGFASPPVTSSNSNLYNVSGGYVTSSSALTFTPSLVGDGGSMPGGIVIVGFQFPAALSISSSPNISLGVAGSGQIGNLTIELDGSVTLTGVASTGAIGTLTIEVDDSTLTGVSSTAAIGTLSISGSSNISLTGVVGSGQIGSLSVSNSPNVSLTGVAGTGAATGPMVNSTIVNIGTTFTNSNAAVNIACTVPAGATICVIWFDAIFASSTGPSAITDTSSNTYTVYDVTVTSTGTVGISYAVNAKAVSGHIICTPHGNGGGVYSAFYVTGVTGYDIAIANSATGVRTVGHDPVIAASSTPAQTDLQIGVVGWQGLSTYSQAPGFASPPVTSSNSNLYNVSGGYEISSSALTFSPTLPGSTAEPWGGVIVGFQLASFVMPSIAGSGQVGSLSISDSSNISLTGVVGSGQVGTPRILTPTGVAGTGQIGSLSISSSSNKSLSGVASTSAISSPSISISPNVTGRSSTNSIGTLSISSSSNIPLAGVSSTGAIGIPWINTSLPIPHTILGILATLPLPSVRVTLSSSGENVSISGVIGTQDVGALGTMAESDVSYASISSVAGTSDIGTLGTESVASDMLIQPVTLPEPIVQAALSVATSRLISGNPVFIFDVPQVVNLVYPVMYYQGTTMLNYPVNRTDFRLLRGVTNEVIFFLRDIDRKPVQLTMGDSLTINIVDTDTSILLMTRNLTVVDLAKGIYQFTTLPAEMDTWPTGPVRWSIIYNRATGGSVMLWTDLSYSPYSHLYVTEGPLPGPAPTVTATWDQFGLLTGNQYYYGPLFGAAQNGYLNGVQTFVYTMNAFIGTAEIDATLIAQPDLSAESPDWFSVDSVTYTGTTSSDTRNVVGNYLWLRIVVTPTINVMIPNPGSFIQVEYKV